MKTINLYRQIESQYLRYFLDFIRRVFSDSVISVADVQTALLKGISDPVEC
jgi:hypothetical protein|tara:strand:+ start:3750 stop:3902 length:153 start_codon:yes stop_codon:yes gene_type:complete